MRVQCSPVMSGCLDLQAFTLAALAAAGIVDIYDHRSQTNQVGSITLHHCIHQAESLFRQLQVLDRLFADITSAIHCNALEYNPSQQDWGPATSSLQELCLVKLQSHQ